MKGQPNRDSYPVPPSQATNHSTVGKMGVHESLTKWSANFLKDQTQRVKIAHHRSDTKTMNAGCPQGNLLGPLAFISYINDMCLPYSFVTIKYVDITTMFNTLHVLQNITKT